MLKWLKKIVLTILLSFFAVPLTILGIWYAISFLPYLNQLKIYAAQGEEKVKNINPNFYSIVLVVETKKGIRIHAIRRAYSKLRQHKRIKRDITEVLWIYASYIHFSESEIFGLWVECLLGRRRDFEGGIAQKYFKKSLENLSEKELASLVAMVWGGMAFAPDTERGEKRANYIIEKYNNYQKQPSNY